MGKETLKVVILGDGAVGKTSLRNQFVHKRFAMAYKATIGSDFASKEVETQDGRKVSMQIWDTAGQERFQSLGVAFYRGTDVCILVYDVTKPESVTNLLKWMTDFIRQADIPNPDSFPFVVVGNKVDVSNRAVSKRQGQEIAPPTPPTPFTPTHSPHSLPLFEVSAKTGTRVDDIFAYIAHNKTAAKQTEQLYNPTISP
ncbi:uncharacterized protein EV422DRAFT_574449 [Fimicolochytrium jonesii]|uniref:uncharacterized protein n=1 Tax=Fimicolochytrium jonesii TaxID=1396493 RepID=UPI0022FF36E2|nr:uncharacterized protein EV422DRAFT_574449 [Fimicolochytrium jonesii]KAI8817982.1 hypothetical protein EV422DRAFT_574449 [Fimicolochytrium jonesii]